MSDEDVSPKTETQYYSQGMHFFVNNCMGSFYRGTLNWFSDVLYPRIQYRVIGTYDKSVEYFTKKKTHGHEIDKNILPSVTLDPAYEFQPAEQGGKFHWQYPFLAPGLGRKLFDSIKPLPSEQSIEFTPVFTRYEGAFDMIFWLHSVYELFDFRTYLLQFTGGYNRYLRPEFFDASIIVPEEIVDYTYVDADGNTQSIDWSNTDLEIKMIDNMGSYQHVLPVKLSPMYKLVSLSDSSEKYGGDSVCEYKLTATFEYELDLPTYFVITPFVHNISTKLNVMMGSTYSRYGMIPVYNPVTKKYERGGNLPPYHRMTEDNAVSNNAEIKDFSQRYIYEFTDEDEEKYVSGEFYPIPNPFGDLSTWDDVIVISYNGVMTNGDDWKIDEDDPDIMLINLEPKEGEIVEIFLYL